MLSGQTKSLRELVAFNLDKAMSAQEVSSAELARRLGLNEKTVRRWRSGEVMPSIERLAEVGEHLNEDALSFYREADAA